MARGTKISEFIKAVSTQLEGKEWELPIIVKNDSNQWENFRISSTDLDEIISDESVNIYNSNGEIPYQEDNPPIERKMGLNGNTLNIGDNVIIKENTIDFGEWLRINKTTTSVGGLNYKYASILYGANPHDFIKWYKNNNSSAAAIAIGERAMENVTFNTSPEGSIILGYLSLANSSINSSNNHLILGREAANGSNLSYPIVSLGAYSGFGMIMPTGSIYSNTAVGLGSLYHTECDCVTGTGMYCGFHFKGSFSNLHGYLAGQWSIGHNNNVVGNNTFAYSTASNNNVFGNNTFYNSYVNNCNIFGNGMSPTQNGHNIWGDLNSTKADIYGLPTFKSLQQKGNLAVDLGGNVYVKNEMSPFMKVTTAELALLSGMTEGDTVYVLGVGLMTYNGIIWV